MIVDIDKVITLENKEKYLVLNIVSNHNITNNKTRNPIKPPPIIIIVFLFIITHPFFYKYYTI